MGLFYSTGQAANELGVSQDRIRSLCDSGMIEYTTTSGGQRRIEAGVVEQLKETGLPSTPRPMPTEHPTHNPNLCTSRPTAATTHQAPPPITEFSSPDTVMAVDEVTRLQALVQVAALRRELAEEHKGLAEIESEEQERLADQEAEEQARQMEEEAALCARRDAEAKGRRLQLAREYNERARRQWLLDAERYGLHALPYDAPSTLRPTISDAIRSRLDRLNPRPGRSVTHELVDGIVGEFVAAWRREQEIERVLVAARDSMLPCDARSWCGPPTSWQISALRAAGAAIAQLRDDAPIEEIRAVAKEAVQKVAAEFETEKLSQQDAAMRQEVIRWASLPWYLTNEEQRLAPQAVAEAVAKLPPGTPRRELEAARDAALAPFHAAVRKRQEEAMAPTIAAQAQATAAAEEQRRQQVQLQQADAIRRIVGQYLTRRLPASVTPEERQGALEAVITAIAGLPAGTTAQEIEETITRTLAGLLTAPAKPVSGAPGDRKTRLIQRGVRGIHDYLVLLSRVKHFTRSKAASLEEKIRQPIREQLERELNGRESAEDAVRLTRRLVRGQLRDRAGTHRHIDAARLHRV